MALQVKMDQEIQEIWRNTVYNPEIGTASCRTYLIHKFYGWSSSSIVHLQSRGNLNHVNKVIWDKIDPMNRRRGP